MAKIKVAIYDADKQYRERFADYLMSYKSSEIELSVFSTVMYFLENLDVENYHLLVLGRGYDEVLPKIRRFPIPVMVLSDGSCVSEPVGMEDAHVVYTSKYQSMDVITHQMYVMAEGAGFHVAAGYRKRQIEVVGVFSPVRHEMQMFFSLLYVRNRQAGGKVLYLNLMEFSGFSELFGEEEYDLEEVILQLRRTDGNAEKIKSCVYEKEGIYYIGAFRNPENAIQFSAQDMEALLEVLEAETDFDCVVVDFGGIGQEFPEMLKRCTRLICLGRRGTFFQAVERQFCEYVKTSLGVAFAECIKRIELPGAVRGLNGGMNALDGLWWSEFGDCVRGVQ